MGVDGGASQTRYVTGGAIPPVAAGGPPAPPRRTASEHAYGDNPKAAGPVSARLEIDPARITFPTTQVGGSATAAVTVRNPDDQAHTLEAAVPVAGDPFSDFAVEQSASELLQPGASQQVRVRFQPSRALSDEQTFQLDTDAGMGPSGELHVTGSGKDQAGTDARVADQDYQRDNVEAARANDPLHKQRVLAERSVRDWAKEAEARNVSYGDWTRANVETFLGKTGGDVHFEGPSLVRKLVVKGLSKAVGKALEVETENPVVDKVAEQLVDKAADYAFEKLMGDEEPPSPEESALDATEHMAKESNARGSDMTRFREQANAIVHDSESGALLRIAQAKTGADLENWRGWGEAQRKMLPAKKDPADRELADDLLVEWVKQRAATPTKAGSQTNTKAWNQARVDLAKSGKLPTTELPDLFIHQCRYEWTRIGIDDAEIDAAIASLEAKLAHLLDQSHANDVDPRNTALEIAGLLGQPGSAPIVGWFHRSADWKRTAAAFAEQNYQLAADQRGREVFADRFDLTCHLNLDETGAGVYVSKFWYSVSAGDFHSDDLEHQP